MQKAIMSLFARTPLHIGAGSSVGAIDQPVVRERHTRFPVIPGSSLKGVLSDLWGTDGNGARTDDARWLFGGPVNESEPSAGALLIGEGKLIAFPVRSAKGSFAWATCPLALSRFKRDTGGTFDVPEVTGEDCIASSGVLMGDTVILEEYAFPVSNGPHDISDGLMDALSGLSDDAVWTTLKEKLVVLSDEAFSHFAENACEVAQHIRINHETGTVDDHALFNQENVPSETLFYAIINSQNGKGEKYAGKRADEALQALHDMIHEITCIQIGADETTGLGWCSVALKEVG